MLIQSIFYNNPDLYPPIINSTWLLAEAGSVVEIVCRDTGEDWGVSYPQSTVIRRIQGSKRNSWLEYTRFVVETLLPLQQPPDIFVGHDMHGLLPARILARRYKRPLVYHCHDFTDATRNLRIGSRFVRAFERRFARTADLMIVPDVERGKVISRDLELKREPLVVANAPLRRPSAPTEGLREVLAKQGKAFEKIILRQGRIGSGHALEVTLRSIPYWSNHHEWGFVLLGYGEPSYLDKLHRIACELNVECQFAILPAVGYDKVSSFTLGADIGHALYEPIHINNVHITTASNKIMEYMAAGIPLLVSGTSSMRSFIDTYHCGVTADVASPGSIAQAINMLLGDAASASMMGKAARKAFEDHFCYDLQFKPVLNSFRSLITAGERPSGV